jgi:hypothetical protein
MPYHKAGITNSYNNIVCDCKCCTTDFEKLDFMSVISKFAINNVADEIFKIMLTKQEHFRTFAKVKNPQPNSLLSQ